MNNEELILLGKWLEDLDEVSSFSGGYLPVKVDGQDNKLFKISRPNFVKDLPLTPSGNPQVKRWFVQTTGDDGANGAAETPFLTLQYAISQASAGDMIIVGVGDFGNITIDKAIAIEGVSSDGTGLKTTIGDIAFTNNFVATHSVIRNCVIIGTFSMSGSTAFYTILENCNSTILDSSISSMIIKGGKFLSNGGAKTLTLSGSGAGVCLFRNSDIQVNVDCTSMDVKACDVIGNIDFDGILNLNNSYVEGDITGIVGTSFLNIKNTVHNGSVIDIDSSKITTNNQWGGISKAFSESIRADAQINGSDSIQSGVRNYVKDASVIDNEGVLNGYTEIFESDGSAINFSSDFLVVTQDPPVSGEKFELVAVWKGTYFRVSVVQVGGASSQQLVAPILNSVVANSGQCTVNFTNQNSGNEDDNLIQYKLNSSGTWLNGSVLASGAVSGVQSGLSNGSLYDFRIIARSGAYPNSDPSNELSQTPNAQTVTLSTTIILDSDPTKLRLTFDGVPVATNADGWSLQEEGRSAQTRSRTLVFDSINGNTLILTMQSRAYLLNGYEVSYDSETGNTNTGDIIGQPADVSDINMYAATDFSAEDTFNFTEVVPLPAGFTKDYTDGCTVVANSYATYIPVALSNLIESGDDWTIQSISRVAASGTVGGFGKAMYLAFTGDASGDSYAMQLTRSTTADLMLYRYTVNGSVTTPGDSGSFGVTSSSLRNIKWEKVGDLITTYLWDGVDTWTEIDAHVWTNEMVSNLLTLYVAAVGSDGDTITHQWKWFSAYKGQYTTEFPS